LTDLGIREELGGEYVGAGWMTRNTAQDIAPVVARELADALAGGRVEVESFDHRCCV